MNWEELFARVRSLLRVKSLQDELKGWNAKLEERVREQVAQLERLGRLKRFFSRPVAEAIVAGGEEMLEPHRCEITAVFLDLRGFTSFTDRADPDEVMDLLRAYHATLGQHGRRVRRHARALRRRRRDDLLQRPAAGRQPGRARGAHGAARCSRRSRRSRGAWAKLGHEVGLGIGIAQGEATLGVIGFEQRWEYAAIGNVPNLAARLCGAARAGEILLDAQTEQDISQVADTELVGPLDLRGFKQPVPAFRLKALRR